MADGWWLVGDAWVGLALGLAVVAQCCQKRGRGGREDAGEKHGEQVERISSSLHSDTASPKAHLEGAQNCPVFIGKEDGQTQKLKWAEMGTETRVPMDQTVPWPVMKNRQPSNAAAKDHMLRTLLERGGWVVDPNMKGSPSRDPRVWLYVPSGNTSTIPSRPCLDDTLPDLDDADTYTTRSEECTATDRDGTL